MRALTLAWNVRPCRRLDPARVTPQKPENKTLLPFRQNRLQGAWPCLGELDPLSSSTKRVDLRAETPVHALRRGRTIPIIDTQRPAASCNTVSVTSSP